MEYVIGLLVLALMFWWLQKRHAGSLASHRKSLGYDDGSESDELEPIFEERKSRRPVPTDESELSLGVEVEKRDQAIKILEKHRIDLLLDKLLNVRWDSELSEAVGDTLVEADEYKHPRVTWVDLHRRSEELKDRDRQGPLFDGIVDRFESLEASLIFGKLAFEVMFVRSEDDFSSSRYLLVNDGDPVANFGHSKSHIGSFSDSRTPNIRDVRMIKLGDWIDELPKVIEALEEIRVWRKSNLAHKIAVEHERQLKGKIDLGDYEP